MTTKMDRYEQIGHYQDDNDRDIYVLERAAVRYLLRVELDGAGVLVASDETYRLDNCGVLHLDADEVRDLLSEVQR